MSRTAWVGEIREGGIVGGSGSTGGKGYANTGGTIWKKHCTLK